MITGGDTPIRHSAYKLDPTRVTSFGNNFVLEAQKKQQLSCLHQGELLNHQLEQ